jgi:hypothetical protein
VIGSQVTSTPAHNVSVLGVGGQFAVDATLQGDQDLMCPALTWLFPPCLSVSSHLISLSHHSHEYPSAVYVLGMICVPQGVINQKIGAIRLSGNVRNFVVGNVRTKMAYVVPPPFVNSELFFFLDLLPCCALLVLSRLVLVQERRVRLVSCVALFIQRMQLHL